MIMSWFKTFCCILLFFLTLSSQAFQSIKFTHKNGADGLSNNSVTTIEKDNLGFMWMGTYNGLNKYDGIQITNYLQKHDRGGLTDSHITYLFNDSQGVLWVGTRNGGLFRYVREMDHFVPFNLLGKGEESFIEIRAIVEDNDQNLWVGTISHGLFRIHSDRKGINQYLTDNQASFSITSNHITALCFDKLNSRLVIGSKSPYIEYVSLGKEAMSYSKVPLISDDEDVYPKKIIVDKDRNIWVATYKKGLFQIREDLAYIRYWNRQNSNLKHNVIFNMLYDSGKNSIWLATDGEGIQDFNIAENSFSGIVNSIDPESLSSNSVLCFFADEAGSVWVGTQYGGVNILDKLFRQYNSLNVFDGLSHNRVKCFLEYGVHKVFVGTDGGGLSVLDRATGMISRVALGNDNLHVNSLSKKKDGAILIGTYGDGLFEYHPIKGSIRKLLPKNFQDNNSSEIFIQDVLQYNDTIVFGTPYGLYYMTSNGKIDQVKLDNPKAPLDRYQLNSIKCLAKDGDTLWVGTKAGFVAMHAGIDGNFNYFKIADTRQGLTPESANIVNRIIVHKEGVLICTDRGLMQFEKSSGLLRQFPLANDIADKIILDLDVDEDNIWICTNDNGLARIDLKTEKLSFITKKDGLQDNSLNAIDLTKEGSVFVGGNQGFNHFDPAKIKSNTLIPKVYFTGFKLFNEEVDFRQEGALLDRHITEKKSLTLKHNQNDISFDFVALNFSSSQNNQYAYMLENFDHDWNYVANKNTATYTNLPPGEFVLRIKAANNDGLWTSEDLKMPITVLSPWYKTTMAYVSYVVLLLILLYGFYKISFSWTQLNHKLAIETLSKKKTEALNRERVEFFTNISHEFKTPLSLILGPVDSIMEKGKGSVEDFRLIKHNASRLLRLVNQLMDFRKNEVGSLKLKLVDFEINKFMTEIVYSFDRFAKSKKIKLQYEACESAIIRLDKDKLDKIVFNLLSNAFRACRTGDAITVSCNLFKRADNCALEIMVDDTGVGIDEKHLNSIFDRFYQVEQHPGSTGIGLSLTKAYMDLFGGHIEVESEKGHGTTFTVTLPVDLQDEVTVEEPFKNLMPSIKKSTVAEHSIGANGLNLRKILIVEDEIEISEFLERAFGNDYDLTKAMDGEEGLNTVYNEWPDLIISDVMMPNMSGFEMCKRIKSDIRTDHIPVVLLTAMASEENMIEGTKYGADLYIPKPFNINLLKVQLKTLFDNIEKRKRKYQKTLDLSVYQDVKKPEIVDPFVDKATKKVLEHIKDGGFSVESLSNELAMHRTNLHHKLKTLTGFTPSEFIRNVRLKEAAKLLDKGGLNINQIAYSVGFNTPAYFTRCFKKQFGCLPGEYKKVMV